VELDKKKYKRDEVEQILDSYKQRYQSEIKELQMKIASLVEENKSLSASLVSFKEKDELISLTLKNAEKQAEKIRRDAEKRYHLEVLALKDFSERWRSYFQYVSEKYPLYGAVKNARELYENICKILGEKEDVLAVKEIDALVKATGNNNYGFNPKSKIEDYIAATSEGGFDLNEVLNPGELKLEDICKELGLIDESL